jgi:vacuolar-type H+-ATPase subunit C/Vma6
MREEFENYYIAFGNLDLDFFKSLNNLSEKDLMVSLSKKLNIKFENCTSKECFSNIDKEINNLKLKGQMNFSKISFSSPFFIFRYLFALENNISKIRFLLKAKYLNLDELELNKLMGVKNE